MAGLEDICLEKYFLEPGSFGPISSVHVADDDLLDVFPGTDAASARLAFIKSLPHSTTLRRKFSGEIGPAAHRPPDYVRILVFLCWMQTTRTRQRGEKDFREMLERQLDERYKGASMLGLNPMWEHLRDYLQKLHGIRLELPDINPHSQIGRTLRIAFPTWRDRAVFRKLRKVIPQDRLLDPLIVSNKLRTSRHLLPETMQSFEHNFRQFDLARMRGGQDYGKTAFWQAWYAIVEEQAAAEELELVEGQYGEFELFRTSPFGDSRRIATPEEASRSLPKPIRQAIGGGVVVLESMGGGRYRASSTAKSNDLLMLRSKLAECGPGAIRTYSSVNARWVLAAFRNAPEGGMAATGSVREFGWHDGVAVGDAYLGRTPLTPQLTVPSGASVMVELNGLEFRMKSNGDELEFPSGVHAGAARATSRGANREILLVARANEVGESRRRSFDKSREFSEDEFYFGTVPAKDVAIEMWQGERFPPAEEVVSIGEALYAMSSRGVALGEAYKIARRGVLGNRLAPPAWEILRAFGDGGWFDFTLLRNFPARQLLQCPLKATVVMGTSAVVISGPTPIAVVERLRIAADAAGGVLESFAGSSPWSLPRYLVRVEDRATAGEFLRRADIQPTTPGVVATSQQGDRGDIHGYRLIGRLDEERGFFDARTEGDLTNGLYRFERNEPRNPLRYRSVVPGLPDENFTSPTIAILSHHMRRKNLVFGSDGTTLFGKSPRIALPSSWARWASDRAMCSGGPSSQDGTWRYIYPVGKSSLSAISNLVQVTLQGEDDTKWLGTFIASASNADRRIFDMKSRKVRGASYASSKK